LIKNRFNDADLTRILNKILSGFTAQRLNAIIIPILLGYIKNGGKEFLLDSETSNQLNTKLWENLTVLWKKAGYKEQDCPWVAEIRPDSTLWKAYNQFWNEVWIVRKKALASNSG
jgi:hypothetical protein